ncbi:MAG: dihydroneopterin aldolase [Bacteroidales bacterium]|nr:dihydroneopterin aldolase [Bacteroidales bacterium]MCM1147860.1 dihydroneopterin aldolase [Bacteroidales bacterium]MCM1206703.1 dihydroneopterin aldolase [Bacillota bacterium]MCM1510899.1 dihydroneopterin aldolase [Clostridium sp.]
MRTSSYIYVEGLRVHAYHGVLEQERRVGNDYLINIKVEYPWLQAAKTDDVRDTLNYAVLAEIVMEQMAVPSALLEHVAGRIAEKVRERFPECTSVDLRITKVAPPMPCDCDGAGVRLVISED